MHGARCLAAARPGFDTLETSTAVLTAGESALRTGGYRILIVFGCGSTRCASGMLPAHAMDGLNSIGLFWAICVSSSLDENHSKSQRRTPVDGRL